MSLEPLNLREAIAAETSRALIAARARRAEAEDSGALDEEEVGVSGTPILAGFLREMGEYKADLAPGATAVRVYEEMRRGDGMVAAALKAVKLPLTEAEWQIQVPDEPNPQEQQTGEFVERALQLRRINLRKVIDNGLLALDFGSAAHENVWAVDDGKIVLADCAARLPITFFRYLVDAHDHLLALEQLGYGGGTYQRVQIPRIDKHGRPTHKLALFVFRQEGANFWGRSILREAYQHWYLKKKLYAIDAIACEKNGMGFPFMTYGPNAKKEDIKIVKGWLAKLGTHEGAFGAAPDGYKLEFLAVKGQPRSCEGSIHHHDVKIAGTTLAGFLLLGEQKGARSLGDTLSDFFAMALQSVASDCEDVINESTIRPLVDFNFPGFGGNGGHRYPELRAQKILSLKIETVMKALADLANGNVGVIEPDDDLENDVRSKLGLPDKGKPRGKAQVQLPQQSRPDEVHRDKGAGAEDTENAEESGSADKKAAMQASEQTAQAVQFRREPRGAEKFLALSDFVSHLDSSRDRVAAALRAARVRVQTEIVHKLVDANSRDMHRVSMPIDERLVAEIETILRGLSSYGHEQVYAERQRQAAGRAPADAAQARVALADTRRDPLGVYADAAVSEYQNNLQQRAANVVLDQRRQAAGETKTKGEIIAAAEAALDQQKDGWMDALAAKAANEAFADGRDEGYQELKDQIRECQYSAILDNNTCDECESADGRTAPTPDGLPRTPNPDCAGKDKCRCVIVYVFADEVPSAA